MAHRPQAASRPDAVGQFHELVLAVAVAAGAGVRGVLAVLAELPRPRLFLAAEQPAVVLEELRVLLGRPGVNAVLLRDELDPALLPAVAARELQQAAVAQVDAVAGERLRQVVGPLLSGLALVPVGWVGQMLRRGRGQRRCRQRHVLSLTYLLGRPPVGDGLVEHVGGLWPGLFPLGLSAGAWAAGFRGTGLGLVGCAVLEFRREVGIRHEDIPLLERKPAAAPNERQVGPMGVAQESGEVNLGAMPRARYDPVFGCTVLRSRNEVALTPGRIMQDFEKEYDQLVSWTKTLLSTVEGMRSQVQEALDPASKLPEHCPSHASMAELVFRQVRKRLDEVVHCVDAVEKAIRETGV